MSRKKDVVLKEYVRALNDDDLRFFCFLLDERKSGDQGEFVEAIQDHVEMDLLFQSAKTAEEFYDLIDLCWEYASREMNNREYK